MPGEFRDAQYPVAEVFHSLQGEGFQQGIQQYFIRLAGCNVGVYTPVAKDKDGIPLAVIMPEQGGTLTEARANMLDARSQEQPELLRAVYPQHSICESALGQKFLCDTDYHPKLGKMTVEALLAPVYENWICITGGEPLIHDLMPLVVTASRKKINVHIETSGTLPIPGWLGSGYTRWICCSPKKSFKKENNVFINEYKFAVNFDQLNTPEELACARGDIDRFLAEASIIEKYVSISPVNPIYTANVGQAHMEKVMEFLRPRPEWRLTVQLHKYLNLQ